MNKKLAIAQFVVCGCWFIFSILFAIKVVEPTVMLSLTMSLTLVAVTFCNGMALLQEKGK